MSIAHWSLFLGVLLITMVMAGTLLARMLWSSAMIYLVVGYVLGPGWLDVVELDPLRYADVLELVAEVAILISLFSVGLKMGVPLSDRRWFLPLRLAFISTTATVALIAAVGMWGLGLPLGGAVLLGGILAPTDPVLASGVQTEPGPNPDRLRFGLAGEGALNDGTAFPFVMLGLGLMGLHGLGAGAWRWWLVDVLWDLVAGVAIGAALGTLIGNFVIYLRTRHHLAVGLDEFLSLGLVAVVYGVAQLCLASGFLAVFAAGLALQRTGEALREGTESLDAAPTWHGYTYARLATHSHHASATMTQAVQGFNVQLEKLAELVMVLLVGTMLPYVVPSAALYWFAPLLFVVVRPLAVLISLPRKTMPRRQQAMIGWFGIRGIGSVFYLMFALHHGVVGPVAQALVTLTLATVAASIMLHGVSLRPLMKWYLRRNASAQ